MWNREYKRDVQAKILLFLFSPFWAFVYSLRRINTKSSYYVFFLFSLFFGLSFSVPNVRPEGGIDGISYRQSFEQYKNITFDEYYDGLIGFLQFDTGKKDYYFDTVAFFISRITDNYHVMFMAFAIVFAFFSLKSYRFLTKELNFDNSWICLILSYLFMYNTIFNINGMRFWTAAWIAVYCIFKIIYEKKYFYFLLALTTPFFHGTFWVFIGLLCLYFLFGRFEKAWIVFFFLSFIVSNVALSLAQDFSEYLPPTLARVVASYTDAEYVQKRNAEGTGFWIVGYIFDILVNVFRAVMVCFFIRERKTIQRDKNLYNLYIFLLILMSFSFFTMGIPSLGVRYINLAFPVMSFIWLVTFGEKKYRWFIYIVPLVYFMTIYGTIRLFNQVLDVYFYFSSPMLLMLKYLS